MDFVFNFHGARRTRTLFSIFSIFGIRKVTLEFDSAFKLSIYISVFVNEVICVCHKVFNSSRITLRSFDLLSVLIL